MTHIAVRYESLQIGGKWFVFDRLHPDLPPFQAKDERDARISADLWNIVAGYEREKKPWPLPPQ